MQKALRNGGCWIEFNQLGVAAMIGTQCRLAEDFRCLSEGQIIGYSTEVAAKHLLRPWLRSSASAPRIPNPVWPDTATQTSTRTTIEWEST